MLEIINDNIIEHKIGLKYLFAGNSLLTVENSETKNRFTFKIKKAKDKELYFISYMYAYNKYKYICIAYEDMKGYLLQFTRKSTLNEESQPYKVIQYIIQGLSLSLLPNKVIIYHHNICVKCGRVLTVPSSILKGMGDHCAKKALNNDISLLFL